MIGSYFKELILRDQSKAAIKFLLATTKELMENFYGHLVYNSRDPDLKSQLIPFLEDVKFCELQWSKDPRDFFPGKEFIDLDEDRWWAIFSQLKFLRKELEKDKLFLENLISTTQFLLYHLRNFRS